MADQFHVRQSSLLTAMHKAASRPHRTEARLYIRDGRACLVLVATAAVAINAWALFPSPDESGPDVPLPGTSAPSAAEVKSAGGVVGGDKLSWANAFTLMAAELVSSKPTMYGPSMRYPSQAAGVSLVPLRSKLQALLMMLYSQSGVVDPAALEAKLQALLKLPDSVLAQLMEHPDLAALNEMLDAVFLGTSDLSGVETELNKIEVTSVPGTSEQIQVIKVNGRPSYTVHSPAVSNSTENLAVSPMSAPAPPNEPAPMASQLAAAAGLVASAFMPAPSSEQSPPAPVDLSAPAFIPAPSSEQLAPPPAPTPTQEISQPPEEPTGTPQTSLDVLNSGNKFEPGETVAQPSTDNSPATQTDSPATAVESSVEAGGGGESSPSSSETGGSSVDGGVSP